MELGREVGAELRGTWAQEGSQFVFSNVRGVTRVSRHTWQQEVVAGRWPTARCLMRVDVGSAGGPAIAPPVTR
eukprot:6254777-Prymnesium_polylepis.1